MTASSSTGHQEGYWGGFDREDALDFARAWIADSPGPSQSQRLATWLDTRQARVELLPAEPQLEPGYIRLRHGTMRPDTFRLHAGQFFATGADDGYGYAWSPGRPDGAVIPLDVPREALLQASMDTPMPHARPGHDPGGLARARRCAHSGAHWVINTTFGEAASLRAAAFSDVVVHRPVPADLIRSRLEEDLRHRRALDDELRRRRALADSDAQDLDTACLLCGAGPPRHEAGCPVPTRETTTSLRRGETRRAGLGL